MTNPSEAFVELLKIAGAVATLTGVMAWWRKGSPEEDEVVSSAAAELLDALSNADTVSKIKGETDVNVRDQISIEQATDWARDRDLRGFGVRRN